MNILVFYINNWTAKKPLGGAKVQWKKIH
jgi:hypothetical protein